MEKQKERTAIDAYLARKASIIAKLEMLKNLAETNFGHDFPNVDWASVGDLGHINSELSQLITMFGKE